MSQQTDFAIYATQAELALAAYADFGKDTPHIENLRRVGMTDSQAEDFLNTWKVVVQINDTITNVSATIFEHISDHSRCLAISRAQPQEPCEPRETATPEAEISLNPDALYANIKAQVAAWIDNGTLPKGATVAGHFIGGHLAVALKKDYPAHISAAYFFMADTSGKIYGLTDNGVFATETRKSIMDLSACKCGGNNQAIAGVADDKPRAMDTTHSKLEGVQPSNKHDLEDNNMKRLVSALLALELLTGCVSCSKMKMDAEVDRLCAIDGGIKVYETVSLPPEKFDKYNNVNFFYPSQGENALGPEYIWKWDVKYLQPGGDSKATPRMWRSHMQVFRRADGRLLGESISYTRYGGDSHFLNELMGGPPESHYSCPKDSVDVVGGVFKNETGRTK
ncbi:MAG: hypothetical protein WC156_14670 [Pedobacter sp.]